MRIAIDIDGTLARTKELDYEAAEVIPDAAARVRQLYEDGHYIIILTGRGSGTDKYRWLTEQQLNEWEIPYHEIRMGVKDWDMLIDDRALSAEDWNAGKWQPPE